MNRQNYRKTSGEGLAHSKQRIFLISLGCAKNRVDSEHILGLLKGRDYPIVSSIHEAEVAIINTCAFIQPSVEETIATILDVASEKQKGHLRRLFVVGCFVQRYGYKLRKEIPEVDGWVGTGELAPILEMLEQEREDTSRFFISRPTFMPDHTLPRVLTTPFYSAYLKISEGCSHRCSYCTIPGLRGPFRSRRLDSLVLEAKGMVEQGVKEINLIAQDTTLYGSDLEGNVSLEDLLQELLPLSGLRWLRILYSHPHGISDRLLSLIEREEKICPYLDLPFQHIDEAILKRMRRFRKGEDPWRLIERIRSRSRPISLRTTLMVGFPGETRAAFDDLCHFVKTVEFDHLGVFLFSPEKGTTAAHFKDVVEKDVAEERLDAIMRLQAGVSKKKNKRMVGHVVQVLLEGPSQETEFLLTGRTNTMAPDVDGEVLINRGNGVVGEILPVRITGAHTYDLLGEILEKRDG